MKVTVKGKEYELEDLKISGNCSEDKEVTMSLGYLDDYVSVYTSDDAWLTKIKKCMLANPDGWKVKDLMFHRDGTLAAIKVYGPPKALKLYNGLDRVLSDEEREAKLENLKKARLVLDSSRDSSRDTSGDIVNLNV